MIATVGAKTDTGRVRRDNEDNYLILDVATGRAWTAKQEERQPFRFEIGARGLVVAVADGMGGALAGDVASRMAVETVREMIAPLRDAPGICAAQKSLTECLREAVIYTNLVIHHRSLDDPRCNGMGATFTGAAIESGGQLGLVQIGDSRAYLLRGNRIKLLTRDQSLVQNLIDTGQISEEEARTHIFRNVILQALGAQSEIWPVTSRVALCSDDLLLLCSDGLSNKLEAEEMRDLLLENRDDLRAACEKLVACANERGGEDNITVVAVHLTGDDLPAADSTEIAIETLPIVDAPDETTEAPSTDHRDGST